LATQIDLRCCVCGVPLANRPAAVVTTAETDKRQRVMVAYLLSARAVCYQCWHKAGGNPEAVHK
jgi:hypothetical protein